MANRHITTLIIALITVSGCTLNCVSDREDDVLPNNTLHEEPSDANHTANVSLNVVNVRLDTALHLAALYGQCPEIERLLKAGMDVDIRNRNGTAPLHNAAFSGHKEAVELLLSHGANPNSIDSTGQTPMFQAAERGSLEIIKLLVKHGAHISKKGYTPLHKAAYCEYLAPKEHKDLVRYFLNKGVSINARGSFEMTPLHTATYAASSEVLNLLVKRGAEIEARDQFGRTPLYMAAVYGNAEAAAFLIARGADVNAKDTNGRTPLCGAITLNNVANPNPEVVKILIDAGANINNVTDRGGSTPLHQAIAWGWDPPHYEGDANLIMIELLLEAGADVYARNSSGVTPLDFAHNKPEIYKLLMKYSQVPCSRLREHADSLDRLGL